MILQLYLDYNGSDDANMGGNIENTATGNTR